MNTAAIKTIPKTAVKLVKGIPRFCKHNSNWLLAALAILGFTGLTWSAIQGTIKAVKLCEEKEVQGAKEVLKTTWKLYIPTLGFFILTTACVVGNAHINGKRLATLTGLYAASQNDILALKKKMAEMIGPKKAKEVEAEAKKDLVEKLPPPAEKSIAKTGHGNDLFLDSLTGQYFRASADYIEAVENEMNLKIQNEVDNILYRSFMQEKFGEVKCGTGELFWDYCDMVTRGQKKIELDVSVTGWMEVNGQREMVSVLTCTPEAQGF